MWYTGQQLVKVSEVAEELGVSTNTVRIWINKGKLKAFKFATRTYRIERNELDRFVRDSRVDTQV